MLNKTAEEIEEVLAPHLASAGISPLTVAVAPVDEPPFDDIPSARVYVSLEDMTSEEVHAAAMRFEEAFNRTFGCDVRTGYYSSELGYDDIPEGQAMIEIDMLPFTLSLTPSPRA